MVTTNTDLGELMAPQRRFQFEPQADLTEPASPGGLVRKTTRLAFLVATADVLTKAAAFAIADETESLGPILPLRNDAGLLGIVSGSRGALSAIAVLVLAVYLAATFRLALLGRVPVWVPGLLAGGAVANLADRMSSGAVHDWLVCGPIVINLADLAVLAAVTGYSVRMVQTRRRPTSGSLSRQPAVRSDGAGSETIDVASPDAP